MTNLRCFTFFMTTHPKMFKKFLYKSSLFISSGFLSGFIPKAPGTAGTFAFTLMFVLVQKLTQKYYYVLNENKYFANFFELSGININDEVNEKIIVSFVFLFLTLIGTRSTKNILQSIEKSDSKTSYFFFQSFFDRFQIETKKKDFKNKNLIDPQFIVIDEWVGMCILFFDSRNFFSLNYLIISFILFRILDGFKPFPIKYFEKLPGSFGIIMDDIVAGLMALFILFFI